MPAGSSLFALCSPLFAKEPGATSQELVLLLIHLLEDGYHRTTRIASTCFVRSSDVGVIGMRHGATVFPFPIVSCRFQALEGRPPRLQEGHESIRAGAWKSAGLNHAGGRRRGRPGLRRELRRSRWIVDGL